MVRFLLVFGICAGVALSATTKKYVQTGFPSVVNARTTPRYRHHAQKDLAGFVRRRSGALFRGQSIERDHAGETEESTLAKMQWWSEAKAELPAGDKYLIFSVDSGGPNNIRIGWEMTALIAQRLGRTLVLPPAAPMYLLDFGPRASEADMLPKGTETRAEDLINLIQLKGNLPTLTWEEFKDKLGYTSFEAAREDAKSVDPANHCKLQSYEDLGDTRLIFMNGHEREGFDCAEWWLTGQPRSDFQRHLQADKWVPLLHNGFVWHADAVRIASTVVNHLGIWDYVALHARYNDFQFRDKRQSADKVMEKMAPFLKPGDKLYIASDEPRKFRGHPLPQGVEIVTFPDLVGTTGGAVAGLLNSTRDEFQAERWFKLKGAVEELICTYAKVFVGTGRSTFTGHIQRMRIDAGAPVTRLLAHTDKAFPIAKIQEDILKWSTRDGPLDIKFMGYDLESPFETNDA